MSFMEKQITTKQDWLVVETTHGTEFLPKDLIGDIDNCADTDDLEDGTDDFKTVQEYCEGEPQSWEWVKGYGARMSAPGYLDCTAWAVFDTVAKAEAYLEEYYGEDEEEEECKECGCPVDSECIHDESRKIN